MSGWRALLVTSHRILVSEWLRTVLPIMPPKRKNYWKTYKRNERAAFEKKHGMSKYMYKKLQKKKALEKALTAGWRQSNRSCCSNN